MVMEAMVMVAAMGEASAALRRRRRRVWCVVRISPHPKVPRSRTVEQTTEPKVLITPFRSVR